MKTKIYLGLCTTVVFAMMACNSHTTTKTDQLIDSVTVDHPTETVLKHTIPVDDIKAMVAKYKQERVDLLTKSREARGSAAAFEDSRCVWFSIEELKEFIKEAESQPVKADGVRMYFTVYPEKKEGESAYMSSIPAEQRNHVTLVLVPTYLNSKDQSHSDFEPLPIANSGAENHHAGDGEGARAAAAPAAVQSTIALNHGGLCPPNCLTSSAAYLGQ
ncbi:MAG TPA: hypothetical protein PLL00_09100 [Bacteroidia bacterium]|nr:hypothetical protein [Bacteroidia bacterium]